MHPLIPMPWPSSSRLAVLALTLVLRALLVNQLAAWLDGGAVDQALHAALAPAPPAMQLVPQEQATRSLVY